MTVCRFADLGGLPCVGSVTGRGMVIETRHEVMAKSRLQAIHPATASSRESRRRRVVVPRYPRRRRRSSASVLALTARRLRP